MFVPDKYRVRGRRGKERNTVIVLVAARGKRVCTLVTHVGDKPVIARD